MLAPGAGRFAAPAARAASGPGRTSLAKGIYRRRRGGGPTTRGRQSDLALKRVASLRSIDVAKLAPQHAFVSAIRT